MLLIICSSAFAHKYAKCQYRAIFAKDERDMKQIVIFAPDNCMPSTLTGPLDVFTAAGVSWNFINAEAVSPCFEVSLVTGHGYKIQCYNGIEIPTKTSWRDIEQADLIFIPSFAFLGTGPKLPDDLIQWFQKMAANGAIIASVCTGAFLLAETGLLDNKRATTHWAFQNQLQALYPSIKLMTDPILVEDKSIITAGGGSAWHDLVLFLIEKLAGLEIANQAAKMFLLDRHDNPQASYASAYQPTYHNDAAVEKAQRLIKKNYASSSIINQAINESALAERTFYRRFKKAAGITPIKYIQLIRIEQSKTLLETTNCGIEEISAQVGYENPSSFRKLFKQEVQLLPAEYRRKFSSGEHVINIKQSAEQ